MFTSTIFLLIPFLMVAFLPLALKDFSSDELEQMGVHIKASTTEPSCESNHILSSINVVYGNA